MRLLCALALAAALLSACASQPPCDCSIARELGKEIAQEQAHNANWIRFLNHACDNGYPQACREVQNEMMVTLITGHCPQGDE